MKKRSFKILIAAGALVLFTTSCHKDLDQLPTNDITAEQVYSTPLGYKQAMAKVYGCYATTGNQGPAGNKDIQGTLDEGNFTDFLRTFWYSQELCTDEAVISWGDPGLPDFHYMTWSPQNTALTGLYYRAFFQITLANDYINQASDGKLGERGISGADADLIRQYRTEARFLRAFDYWVLMDAYANPAFITENDVLGSTLPRQIDRKDLFDYIESELLAIQNDLVDARANEYGRADKAAAWSLLARIYLNAEVYTGTARWNDAITYSKKVIDAGYSLSDNYRQLFLADNNLNRNEFILTINYDGLKTQSFGGMTFLTHASVGGSMSASESGVQGGWAGIRATKNLPNLFPGDFNGDKDKRAQFAQAGQKLDINDISNFTDGFGVPKYRNIKRDGTLGQSLEYADIDFPLFRLPEMYLIYAEAVLRGGTGGDLASALNYINLLRARAYGTTSEGQVTADQLTTNFILDERGRELHWECFRRTDLVRYNKFVEGSYLWPYKAGAKDGQAAPAFRKIYPIPSVELATNTNLKQNTGY